MFPTRLRNDTLSHYAKAEACLEVDKVDDSVNGTSTLDGILTFLDSVEVRLDDEFERSRDPIPPIPEIYKNSEKTKRLTSTEHAIPAKRQTSQSEASGHNSIVSIRSAYKEMKKKLGSLESALEERETEIHKLREKIDRQKTANQKVVKDLEEKIQNIQLASKEGESKEAKRNHTVMKRLVTEKTTLAKKVIKLTQEIPLLEKSFNEKLELIKKRWKEDLKKKKKQWIAT